MSDLFKGITFPWQEVTPADDAIVRKAILPDRRLTGCELSYSGYTLTMTAGVLIVCGRQFRHTAAQNWAVTGAASGYARLLLTIDVTKASTEDAFEQITASIEYATAADGFPDLRQDDINNAGTIYQTSICVVALGPGGITGFTGQILPGDNVFYPGRPVSMGNHRVKDVAAPEEDGDAVNRGYADEHYRSNTWMPTAKQIGKMEKTLKWTNASPNSTFSAQTVSMDLNGYDAVIVEGRFNADSYYDPFKTQSVMCPIGHSAPLLVSYDNPDGGGLASRVFTAYTTGPAFRYGHNAVAKTSNDAMAVPTRIYGVKFFT